MGHLARRQQEIRDMLRRAVAKPGSSLSTSNRYPNPKYQRRALPLVNDFLYRTLRREIRNFTVEWRNMLLVVVVLLATLSYQAVLTPPSGVWEHPFQITINIKKFS